MSKFGKYAYSTISNKRINYPLRTVIIADPGNHLVDKKSYENLRTTIPPIPLSTIISSLTEKKKSECLSGNCICIPNNTCQNGTPGSGTNCLIHNQANCVMCNNVKTHDLSIKSPKRCIEKDCDLTKQIAMVETGEEPIHLIIETTNW